MSDQNIATPSMEERLGALENQCFVMYLQLNAITKILIDGGTLDKEILTKEMDDLNKQLYEVTKEMMEKAATEEAPADGEVAVADPTPVE